MDEIKKTFKANQTSLEKTYRLLKEKEQQNTMLTWDLSHEEVLEFFDLEFDSKFFTRKKIYPEMEKNIKSLEELLKHRYKADPLVEVEKLLKFIDKWQHEKNLTEDELYFRSKHQAFKEDGDALKKVVILYSYVPEIFWWKLPKAKEGVWRKGAIISYWYRDIAQENWDKISLYVKMKNKAPQLPVLELEKKGKIKTKFDGFRLLENLEFPKKDCCCFFTILAKRNNIAEQVRKEICVWAQKYDIYLGSKYRGKILTLDMKEIAQNMSLEKNKFGEPANISDKEYANILLDGAKKLIANNYQNQITKIHKQTLP